MKSFSFISDPGNMPYLLHTKPKMLLHTKILKSLQHCKIEGKAIIGLTLTCTVDKLESNA